MNEWLVWVLSAFSPLILLLFYTDKMPHIMYDVMKRKHEKNIEGSAQLCTKITSHLNLSIKAEKLQKNVATSLEHKLQR
jgi:hypothetical protein